MNSVQRVYGAFGLTVSSNVDLPGLSPPGKDGRRVLVRVAPPVDRTRAGTGPPSFSAGMERTWRTRYGWLLRYDDPRNQASWTMRVSAGGGAIDVERTKRIDLQDLLEVVGTVGLASALQLQGGGA